MPRLEDEPSKQPISDEQHLGKVAQSGCKADLISVISNIEFRCKFDQHTWKVQLATSDKRRR